MEALQMRHLPLKAGSRLSYLPHGDALWHALVGNSSSDESVQKKVLRFRWSDRETDEATSLTWPRASLIGATLFLNFSFWMEQGLSLWSVGVLQRSLSVVAAGSLLTVALFFLGPALTAYRTKRTLFAALENSVGSIPAWGVRLCCVCFLTIWVADLLAWPASLYVGFILRRNVSSIESAVISTCLLVFLLLTGLQSFQTTAKLAFFSNKLGVAVLVAALIRVHQGLPAAVETFSTFGEDATLSIAWHGLSLLALYSGPLVLFLADFGSAMQTRKHLALTAGIGIVLPLSGTLLLLGVAGLATHASRYYQPSMEPSIAMALWSKAAPRALPGLMLIASITMFGAGRFGLKTLRDCMAPHVLGHRMAAILLGGVLGMIVWCSVHPFEEKLAISFRASALCLAVAAAVLTADFVSGRGQVVPTRPSDWVGLAALIAGLATALCVRLSTAEAWWEPGLLPGYGVAFTFCVLGRALQDRFTRISPHPAC